LCVAAGSGQPRIVAVGDVHGDLNAFVGILRASGLIDAHQNWSGGKSIFVQVGDVLDRGAKGRQLMDLLMKLETQAGKSGGRVYPLLGNHEVMNLMHDLRYVPEDEYKNFADAHSQKKLDDAYESYKQFLIAKAERLKQPKPEFNELDRVEWMKSHPPGFMEHLDAFGPNGKYGKWLRGHSAVLELDHTVFVHGGISPQAATMTVQLLNDKISQEIQIFDRIQKTLVDQKIILPFFTFDEILSAASEELQIRGQDETLEAITDISNWLSVSPEGPLWFRGYSRWSDEEIATQLPPVLLAYHAQHIVVGHTVQPNGKIRTRLDQGAIMIDTGMNSAFFPGGQASALEIDGQKLTAIYGEAKILLTPNQ
jgi:hypothetical protein